MAVVEVSDMGAVVMSFHVESRNLVGWYLSKIWIILQNLKQQDGLCSASVFSLIFDGIFKGLLEIGLWSYVRCYFIKNEMDWACDAYGWGEGVYRVLVGKPECKRPLGRPRRSWGIMLGWISRRWDVGIWTGLGWLRIETDGGRLWVR